MRYIRPQPGTVLRQIMVPFLGRTKEVVTERDCRPHYARGDVEFEADSYLSISAEDRAGTSDEWFEAPRMGEPTDAYPGTPEKVEVMERRVRCGESIHHPQDRNGRQP